jgi:endonuclease YncB( thermonuclease family)
LTTGICQLGRYGSGRGSVVQQVHDGDTIIVEASGNISIRFLGIDTPEVSFTLPGSNQFRAINSAGWIQFLTDPFNGAPNAFINSLVQPLHQHLINATGASCASNHADNAHRNLEQLIQGDIGTLSQNPDTFYFFLAFAHEIMDGYGRLLCFVNRNQEDPNIPEPRPNSYNERMLENGMACPYVNPFRTKTSIVQAVPQPGNINNIANDNSGLGPARRWVNNARQQNQGIFDSNDPLTLQLFELRFLARQQPPNRWVIDLSDPNADTLLRPINYHTIQNIEDRLFIPEEYVPLFVDAGWQRQP